MARKRLPVRGTWAGENSAEDATLIDPMESSDMLNVDPSETVGELQFRKGRTPEVNLSMPITSEYDDGTTAGGRITGLFEFNLKEKGSYLLVVHPQGVDYAERRGPVLEITTFSPLAAGTDGSAYTDDVVCRGGKTTYTWSVSGGALPTGLSLSGSTTTTETISGTPSVNGTFIFTMKVVDSSEPSQVAYRRFTVVIAAGGGA